MKDWNREKDREEYQFPEEEGLKISISTGRQAVSHYQFQGNSGNPSGQYRINPLIRREGIIVVEEDWETSSAINAELYQAPF